MKERKKSNSLLNRWFSKQEKIRFLEYTLIGLLSFGFDLLLIWIALKIFGIHYIISVSVAFIFATIFNYSLNRIWSFHGTKTKAVRSYFLFLVIATLNLGIIAGMVYILVEFMRVPVAISRIIAGLILFVSNFILNSFFVFKIVPPKNKK